MKKGLIIMLFCLILISLIGIISAESGETNVEFSLASIQHSCQYNAEGDVSYWVWWESEPPPDGTLYKDEIGIPIPPKSSCYYQGGWPSDGCCPDNIQCVSDDSDVFYGQCNGFAPDVCSDYNEGNYGTIEAAESYCKAFNSETAIRSIEYFTDIEGICSGDYSLPIIIAGKSNCNQYTSNCRCYWDDGAGECKSTSTSYVFCEDGQYSEGNCTQGNINKNDECNEKGLITYIWESIWEDSIGGEATRPDFCQSGIKTFPCNMVKLSFFTFINIVLVILIVVVIYCFINKKRDKYKEEFKK
jgi:hypothetical protein